AALLRVESLAVAGTTLSAALDALAAEFGRFEYGRRDVLLPVPLVKRYVESVRRSPPTAGAGGRVTGIQDLDGVKYLFGERGWLLHRLSGTEAMVRLYSEHVDGAVMERIRAETAGRLGEVVEKEG